MMQVADRHPQPSPRAEHIGPGRLVLVVGPSGAGKDTLIDGARTLIESDAVKFPKRVITRASSVAEDNEAVSESTFAAMERSGAFALWWEAHGHHYGIRNAIDIDLRASRDVVCNVSRTVINDARQRYAHVTVVLVTAPSDVLERRLKARSRPSDSSLAARLRRATSMAIDFDADVTIQNEGKPADGISLLLDAIRDHHVKSPL